MNSNEGHYGLYEQDEYDPLDDPHREQLFVDSFWDFSETEETAEARQILPLEFS